MRRVAAIAALAGAAGLGLSLRGQRGADELAREAVQAVDQNYTPWWSGAGSAGSESLWAGVQAALGAAMLAIALSRLGPRG